MNYNIRISLLIIFSTTVFSCTKVGEKDLFLDDIRAIIVSEGQYTNGTGSLTTLTNSREVSQDIFRNVNNRPLGDVPQSLTKIGGYYYIPVNNSEKVEVIDSRTFKSIETMNLKMRCVPMYAVHLGGDSIIVSDQTGSAIPGSSDISSLMVVDINHGADREIVRRAIRMPFPTFQMKLIGNKLFVGGAEFSVFDLDNLTIGGIRSVKNSNNSTFSICDFSKIVTDKNGNLWIVSPGSLSCIDVESEKTIKEISLPVRNTRSTIDICPKGETIYVNIREKVYSIDVDNPIAPKEPFINHDNNDRSWTTYCMSISKENTIFIIRVLYGSITRGRIFEYSRDGELLNSYFDSSGREQPYFRAGIFPSFIYFL